MRGRNALQSIVYNITILLSVVKSTAIKKTLDFIYNIAYHCFVLFYVCTQIHKRVQIMCRLELSVIPLKFISSSMLQFIT